MMKERTLQLLYVCVLSTGHACYVHKRWGYGNEEFV